MAPALWAAGEGTTLHPMASYSYLSFDGGHDGRWEAGGQIRRSTSLFAAGGNGLWFGAEGAVGVIRTHLEDVDTESTGGGAVTALAGIPLGEGRWGVSLYAGAGVSRYGTTGRNVRVGLDLQPWFLRRQ
jgi:hypothetical protein